MDSVPPATQTHTRRIADLLTVAAGCGMVAYHMVVSQGFFVTTFVHQSVHLAFAIFIVLVSGFGASGTIARIVQTTIAAAGLGAATYVAMNIDHLNMVLGFPEPVDMAAGVILMVAVIEATRRSWGLILPIVAGVFILYFFLGHLLPGPLYHREFSFGYVISYLSVGLTGIYGTFLSISANQIFLFVVFGALFAVLGIDDFLSEVGKIVGRRVRSGPAQTAVVSSSLVGMITGASVANVAVTGAFTIPYMKRSGYSPELAGAIEATASTGGQLMPPVMGAAAFLMAFFIGVPYVDVMLLGILPALLFYLGVLVSVHFASVQEGIFAPTEKPDYRLILNRSPAFVLPLGVIITLLLMRYSPDVAAFWAIVTALAIGQMRRDRPSLAETLRCLARGAVVGSKIAVSLAVVGLIAQTLISTGLGSKIAGLVETFSGGNLIIALLITMVVSIILGCGVPPAAAYSLVAITAAPTLVKMGLSPISAHFFAFYFAIMSAVTPPVALGTLAATALSGGRYMLSAAKGFKLALSGFIIPFFMVFNPVLRLEVVSWDWALGALVTMPIALIALSAAIYGHALRRLSSTERLIAAVAAISAFAYLTLRQVESIPLEYPLLVVCLATFTWLGAGQLKKGDAVRAR
ncbi:TRAP transporter permease [Futiania mangrovi]|uniref:TRAP transporter fused permease subunit n=1 Tax=Futiania mangrovi TaxID=2959716 RepID=A0A9J6PAN9_9PROT|nr:TRAP transporter fused permease subunit [Futiania mangrovii]MCP1337164.1 TRAP transporter fused permease subunit [Futiania mangrovii]